jgi:hypothetical protein
MKNGIGVIVTPVPVRLPLGLAGAIPIHVTMVAPLPIDAPGALFMFIEIVVVSVVPIVDMVTVVVMLVPVVIVILRH